MNYTIKIQKATNLQDELILHYAERNTPAVNYLGGQDKTQPIVGSECVFTLEVGDGADAKYEQYFTSDEKEWRVTMEVAEEQQTPELAAQAGDIVWRGYLLPESYEEPWDNPLFYVSFSAVDGLGLLKGKRLPKDFYSAEKTVVEIISECLQLTKIDFDIFLAPAIQNHLHKNWKDIIVDTRKYYDKDDLPSAYVFLEELMSSMLCQLSQSQGRWSIEGFNRKHLTVVSCYVYSITGEYKGTVDVEKNVKEINGFLGAPTVTMVPALGEVNVKHEAAKLEVPTDIYKETDIRWVIPTGVDANIYPRYWDFVNYTPEARPPEYYLELKASEVSELDESKKIVLKERPYVEKGYWIRFKLAVEHIIWEFTEEEPFEYGELVDVLVYKVSLNGREIFFNKNTDDYAPERLVIDNSRKGEVTLEFVAEQSGYLDIEIFEPIGRYSNSFYFQSYFRISELSIENLLQTKNTVYSQIIAEGSSLKEDIDLAISDDIIGNSKSFYLEKLRRYNEAEGTTIEVPILYHLQENGKNYSFVSLKGGALIERYPDHVTWKAYFFKVDKPKVIYNFKGGDEVAIETWGTFETGSFFVEVHPYVKPQIDRAEWVKWTDAVYGVEQKPYAQVVAEIYERMFSKPHLRIRGVLDMPCKFNDIFKFTYKGLNKYFTLSDLQWNPDENEAEVTLIEGVYAGESLGNIPPYIDAGPDLELGSNAISVNITGVIASDPDGYIETILWEQLSGDTVAEFSDTGILNPTISNLTGDHYIFQVTVTDNFGISSSDEIEVKRKRGYVLNLELLSTDTEGSSVRDFKRYRFSLKLFPEYSSADQVNFRFKSILSFNYGNDHYSDAHVIIERNGIKAYEWAKSGFGSTLEADEFPDEGVLSFRESNEYVVELFVAKSIGLSDDKNVSAYIQFTSAEFVAGDGYMIDMADAEIKV